MKILLFAFALFTLGGCATAPLTPTSVNPALTSITNNAMALVAASSGDCSVPITVGSVGAACANLPATSTVDADKTAFEGCIAAAAGARVGDQVAAIKAAMCAKAGTVPVVVPVVVPKP